MELEIIFILPRPGGILSKLGQYFTYKCLNPRWFFLPLYALFLKMKPIRTFPTNCKISSMLLFHFQKIYARNVLLASQTKFTKIIYLTLSKNIIELDWMPHGVMCFWILLNFLFISTFFDILTSLSISRVFSSVYSGRWKSSCVYIPRTITRSDFINQI